MNGPKSGLISHQEIAWSEEPDNHLRYKPLVTAKEHGADISATFIEIDGEHHELKTDSSSRLYVLLAGTYTFTINDEESFKAIEGDLVYIKRGDRYRFTGKGRYLVINAPAFQPGDDIYSDGVKR